MSYAIEYRVALSYRNEVRKIAASTASEAIATFRDELQTSRGLAGSDCPWRLFCYFQDGTRR